jgi:hypothetical protein
LVFEDGDHSLRRRDAAVVGIVAHWLTDTGMRNGTRQ